MTAPTLLKSLIKHLDPQGASTHDGRDRRGMVMIMTWICAQLRDRGLLDKDLGDFMGWTSVMTSKVLADHRHLRADEFLDILRFFDIPSPIEGITVLEAPIPVRRETTSPGMPVRRAVKGVPLTKDSAAFVASYVEHGNATKAAIAAGYPERSAHAAGHRMLKKPEIQEALKEARVIVAEQLRVSSESILHRFAAIGFGTMADFIHIDAEGQAHIDLGRANPEQLHAIQEIYTETILVRSGEFDEHGEPIMRTVRKTRLKLHDPEKSLERLGKQLFGMFPTHVTTQDDMTTVLTSMMKMVQASNAALPIRGPERATQAPAPGATYEEIYAALGGTTPLVELEKPTNVERSPYVRPAGVSSLLDPPEEI